MADNAPTPARSQPLRGVAIPASFRFDSVDDFSEEDVGHEIRQRLRRENNLPDDVSVLHPDRPSLSKRAAIQPAPTPAPAPAPAPTPKPAQKPIIPADAQTDDEGFPRGGPPHPDPGHLGAALSRFVGEFHGNGFNTILRPQNGAKGQGLQDNLLELNWTHETLTFLSENILDNVPNRGFNEHQDVNLKGVPYTQQIKDLTNPRTGKADRPLKTAKGIHFEQGLFMRTPAVHKWIKETKDNKVIFTISKEPDLVPTISRMASIPHGTTINAQARDPTNFVDTPPVFADLDKPKWQPFLIGTSPPAIRDPFPQTKFETGPTIDRIPLDLQPFKDAGTITRAQFLNPENFLAEYNKKIKILRHITFEVDTKPDTKKDLWGGGTDNIQQLAEKFRDDSAGVKRMVDFETNNFDVNTDKEKVSTANASAVQVKCRYWISEVQDTITVPVYKKANLPRINNDPALFDDDNNIVWPVVGPPTVEGLKKPYFQIKLPENKVERKVTVVYNQIQYSQNVSLNFGTLTWPHISVATLIPAHPLIITEEGQLTRLK